MSGIVAGIVIVIVINVAIWAIRVAAGTARAVARTASGKGSFAGNWQASVVGMKPAEFRLFDDKSSESIEAKEIQIKGLLPIRSAVKLGFVTSIFDNTSGTYEAVISSMDQFQEPRTIAYQHTVDLGPVTPGIGFPDWTRVGVVLPQLLGTPYGGSRKLVACLRLINLDNKPAITNGFNEKDAPGILWQTTLPFEYIIKSKGYLEIEEIKSAGRAIGVKIALAVAMREGALSQKEGERLKAWVEKVLGSLTGERREKLKNELNGAMKAAYEAARRGNLSLPELIATLKKYDDKSVKYETVELCYEVLASGGAVDSDKAGMIDRVVRSLDLDMTEIEKIRDMKIVSLASGLRQAESVEQLLGIDPQWGPDKIKRHLRAEFQKWNNRITSLPEGPERDSAQRMLDAISEARKRYG